MHVHGFLEHQAPLITHIKIESDELIPEMVPLTRNRLSDLLAILWKMKGDNSGLISFYYYYLILRETLFPEGVKNQLSIQVDRSQDLSSLFRCLPRGCLFSSLQRYANRYDLIELKKTEKIQPSENFFRHPRLLTPFLTYPISYNVGKLFPFLTIQTQPQIIKAISAYTYKNDKPYDYLLDFSTLQNLINEKKISLDNLRPYFLEPQRYLEALK